MKLVILSGLSLMISLIHGRKAISPCSGNPEVKLFPINLRGSGDNLTWFEEGEGVSKLFLSPLDPPPAAVEGQISQNALDTNSVRFMISCEHCLPIHWVFNEDSDSQNIRTVGLASTNRTFQSYADPSTYRFIAQHSIQLRLRSEDFQDVFSCQPFQPQTTFVTGNSFGPGARRSVVLASGNSNVNTTVLVRVLHDRELGKRLKVLEDLDTGIINAESVPPPSTNGTEACPLRLTFGLISATNALVDGWEPDGGIRDQISILTIPWMVNYDRFYPQMEEKCIDFVGDDVISTCSYCREVSPKQHLFALQVFKYARGNDRSILRTFFDFAVPRNVYYFWEKVDSQSLVHMSISDKKTFYKGEKINLRCFPSVFLFSFGTQIMWSLTTNGTDIEGTFEEVKEEDYPGNFGSYIIDGNHQFNWTFLTENRVDSVQLTCSFPVWNSQEWVNKTVQVTLADSELPIFIDDNGNTTVVSGVQVIEVPEFDGNLDENLTISCEATGVPLPTVEFSYPQNNLEIGVVTEETQNGTSRRTTLYFDKSNITDAYDGEYTCFAKSLVGENTRKFRLKIIRPFLSTFLWVTIILASVLVLIFVSVGTALTYKLKKEKEEFIRATMETIKKFEEGFENNEDLGFKGQGEYKDYEIPITRWSVGNTMLGKGAFGVVNKGFIYRSQNHQDLVAVKTVNSPKDIADFENSLMELTIMSYIGKHEHVVSLIGACTENIGKRSVLIGVEFCANGDLLHYLQKRKVVFQSFVGVTSGLISLDSVTGIGEYTNVVNSGTSGFTTLDLYKWSFQIANGMDYLASKKILHADLAARNVLLTSDNIAKISDFGLSRQLIMSDNYTKKTNAPLPWKWMSIEALKFRQFSAASDMWAYGVTLYEIFTLGDDPWPGMAWTNEFQEQLERGLRISRPKYATNNLYDKVMLECWRNEPTERMLFSEAKAFFENAVATLTSLEGKDGEVLNAVC